MEKEASKLNLRQHTSEERDLLRRAFLNQYRKTGEITRPARELGISEETAKGWVFRFRKNGGVFEKERKRGRRIGTHKTLSAKEEKRLIQLLVDKSPQQYKFRFALWTARAVQQLIRVEFDKEMPDRTVRHYLHRLGFTSQRPERRAREQRPKEVQKWLGKNYPRIAEAAKSMGYEIFWGDEAGVSTRVSYQRGYAPKGKTPILEVTSVVSCRVNMISAVSNRGKLHFRLFRGGLTILKFLKFIRDLQRDAGHPIVLIVDNLRIHHARVVRAWLRKRRHLVRVFYLPAYSPELNADELVNSDLKIGVGKREPAKNREELEVQMREHMEENRRNPEKMKRLFHKESVKYAAE